MSRHAPLAPAVSRARLATLGAFGVTGLMAFAWLARIPSIRDPLGLTTADLGLVLLAGSLGALATVVASPRLLRRWGSRQVLLAGAVASSVGHGLIGFAPALDSLAVLVGAITVQGMGGALVNVVLNVESARIETAMGRSVLPHFHAAFSVVAIAGSMLGAVCSWLEVPVAVQFSLVAVLGLGLRLWAVAGGLVLPAETTRATPALAPQPRRESGLAVWRESRTLVIGLVGASCVVSEGSAQNWISLALVDGFARPEATGGLVLGVFIGSQAAVRLFGPALIDRWGRVLALRFSTVLAMAGVLLFSLASGIEWAVAGAVAWGAGAALAFPIAVSAASDNPLRAADRVAVLSSLATTAGLVAPPVLGVLAGVAGVRHALLVVAVLLVVAILVAPRLAPPQERQLSLLDEGRAPALQE